MGRSWGRLGSAAGPAIRITRSLPLVPPHSKPTSSSGPRSLEHGGGSLPQPKESAMLKSKLIVVLAGSIAAVLAILVVLCLPTMRTLAAAQTPAPSDADRVIDQHAQHMIEEGRRIFRYDTFGSEAFWGDALHLHKAIAGAKNGGVGS